ncbi:hypothetical protein [Actinacidiphila glaucinigra]|uniref:hypothetical protein n=1 Tax=Actinacidiphila glaucinigra TaxID=235986 RepID=UPI003D8FD9E5
MTGFSQAPWEMSAMSDLDSQVPNWDAAAATKTFTHPSICPGSRISRHAAILDYGSDTAAS